LKRHKEQPFDIIQTTSCFACGLLSAFRSPVPLVTRVSSYEPLFRQAYRKKLTLDQKLCEKLELLALRYSKAVYTPSEFLAGVLCRQKGLKVDILPPLFILEAEELDSSVYQQQLADKKYLLFFGTIGFLKGGEVLAKSLPSVLAEYPEMYFVFVGKDFPGPHGQSMLQYIMQQAGSYKKRIIYLGVLRHAQLYPVIAHSQAVVLPSLVDNLANTMLEAMALGCVVIGTRGTSFEELIDDGVSGILVAPDNAVELSQAMRRVWNMSDAERERLGHAAQRYIAPLSPERTCAKLEQYFKNVCLRHHQDRIKFL
jgi:glycosyltransferase involved in cell wall biosynthesis